MPYFFEIIKWWLAVEIIGFISLPVTSYVCSGLSDRGYAVSKIMGLLLLTYFSWILTYSGTGYGNSVVFVSLFLILAVSCISYRKNGITINRSFIIKNELFFAAVFIIFLIIRSYSPDNYDEIGEKFMDVAFINSILRSSTFPPIDSWFSGMPVNYYYFGYLLVADMVKLTATPLPVGFNIASAMFFALSASAAFGIGFALVKKAASGLITFLFVLFSGNLVGFIQLLVILFSPGNYSRFYVQGGDMLTRLSAFSPWPSVNVIPGSISEMPYHAYLIGDLHPNMVSISFQLLILAVLLSAITAKKITYIQAIMLGLIAGFLYPLNTWDYPTYTVLTLAAVFLTIKNIKSSILLSGLIVILTYLFYFPYHAGYLKVSEIAVIASGRTELVHYLLIFGAFIFIIFYYLINNQPERKDRLKWLICIAVLLPIAFIIEFQLLILLVPLVLLAYMGMIREKEPEKQFIYLVILAGALVSLFAELFYIRDAMSKLVYFRFNTIFKLYSQIWILWGIATSYVFYGMLKKKAARVACIWILLMVSIYPVLITISQSVKVAPTLDGERSIKREHPDEYEAIEWLRSKNGTPVVLQASGFSYAWNSYISAFTGLPAVLGWEWHEYQWRMNLEEINSRRSDVERAYTSSNYEDIKKIVNKYNIIYIYIGTVERERYKITDVFRKQPEKFKLVFKKRDVEIYEVQ